MAKRASTASYAKSVIFTIKRRRRRPPKGIEFAHGAKTLI
jgi:hypothetical protein